MNIIYGKYTKEQFDAAVQAHVEKLAFNTREEYLLWVQQWKEDYRHMLFLRRVEKLKRFTLKDNIEKANRQIALLETKFDRVKARKLAAELSDRIAKEYNRSFYSPLSIYFLIMYLLVARKASKIRAGQKRAERIAAEKPVTV